MKDVGVFFPIVMFLLLLLRFNSNYEVGDLMKICSKMQSLLFLRRIEIIHINKWRDLILYMYSPWSCSIFLMCSWQSPVTCNVSYWKSAGFYSLFSLSSPYLVFYLDLRLEFWICNEYSFPCGKKIWYKYTLFWLVEESLMGKLKQLNLCRLLNKHQHKLRKNVDRMYFINILI